MLNLNIDFGKSARTRKGVIVGSNTKTYLSTLTSLTRIMHVSIKNACSMATLI